MDESNKDQDWTVSTGALGTALTYASKDPIIFQGDKAKTIGVVLSGTAKATFYSEDGQELWIGRFVEGDFIGHTAILTDTVLDFEVVAESDVYLLQIPISKFQELLATDSSLADAVCRDLARRLNMMTNRLIEAVTLSAPGRICAELVRLSKPIGVEPNKSVIRPNPVFIDIALRVNSTRETVSRTVNALLKDGVASREPGAILIHQPNTLKAWVK